MVDVPGGFDRDRYGSVTRVCLVRDWKRTHAPVAKETQMASTMDPMLSIVETRSCGASESARSSSREPTYTTRIVFGS